MSRWMIGCALSFSLCGWLGMACASPAAADDTAVDAIETALAAPADIEFVDTPIQEVCQFLRELCKINVFLDEKSLADAGQSPDSKFTGRFRGISLESALQLGLGQLDLAFVIRDESLVITSKEVADTSMESKVYPVGDLLDSSLDGFQTEPMALVKMLTAAISPHSWDEVGGPGVMRVVASARSIVCVNHRAVHRQLKRMLDELRAAREAQGDTGEEAEDVVLRVYRLPAIRPEATAAAGIPAVPSALDAETTEQLAEALQMTVEPESWDQGSVSTAGNALFVRQTPAVHAKVRAALKVFAPHAASTGSGSAGGLGGGGGMF